MPFVPGRLVLNLLLNQQRMMPIENSVAVPETLDAKSTRHRILLVEDHPVVTTGLDRLINYEQDLEVCGIADDSSPALHKSAALQPDLVLLDLNLKGGSGLQVLKRIKSQQPDQKVLVLAVQEKSIEASRAFRAGACGYVSKQQPTGVLLRAIRHVLRGGKYVSDHLKDKVLLSLPRGGSNVVMDPLQDLTDRELQIFKLFGQGKRTIDVAKLLGLRIKTVESHRTNIKHKLGLESITALVQQAIELQHEA